MSDENKPTIVVTGFGPFRNYKINASWEAVKLLRFDNVKLITLEIPVAYDEVDEKVPSIWKQYDPLLVVHCGVSCQAKCLVLESGAFDNGYKGIDIHGCLPKKEIDNKTSDGLNDACSCINTKLNVSLVCDRVNQRYEKGLIKIPSVVSRDAGRLYRRKSAKVPSPI